MESLRHGHKQIRIECPVPEGAWLVGMPGRAVTTSEAMAAGMSSNLAGLMVIGHEGADRWCVVEYLESKPRLPGASSSKIPIAASECHSTELQMSHIVHTRSTRVRLTLVRSAEGRAALQSFEARSEPSAATSVRVLPDARIAHEGP